MKQDDQVAGIFFGFILGVLIISFLIFIFNLDNVDSIVRENSFSAISTFATLIAGAMAYLGIQKQIQKSEDLMLRENFESLRAARAMLPVALSKVTEVCRENLYGYFETPSGIKTKLQLIDSDSLQTIKECIKFADDISGERLAQILRIYQILLARHNDEWFLHPLKPHKRDDMDVDHSQIDQMVNWAVLDAISGSAYSYARGGMKTIPQTIDGISLFEVFHINGGNHEDYPILFDHIVNLQKSKSLEMNFEGR